MKTHSKLMNRSAAFCASVLMLLATNASASNEVVDLPAAHEAIIGKELTVAPPSNLHIVSISPLEYSSGVHIRCNGQSSGRATVVVSGGVAPYTYQWSGLPSQTGSMAVGMSAGNYTVTVTDAVGNSVSGGVTLIENPPLQAVANVSPILCHGGVATVTISAVGGTAPYSGQYWYQTPAGETSYTVADAHGCRNRINVSITEPPVFEASSIASPILCHGDMADVLVEASGGTAPYYGTGFYSEPSGTSSYNLIDANGCYAYTSVTIPEPQELVVDISNTEIQCRGGVSEVTVSGLGGIAPYFGTGSFPQMPAGNFSYTITDANGCQSSSSVTITQPSALVATISNTPIACNGDLSAIEVLATGGIAPYTGPGMYYLQSGLHNFNVTDANGCSVDISTIVLEPRAIELDVTWSPAQEGFGVIVDVQASGGTPAYTGTGSYYSAPGSYTISVSDANGCQASEAINIPNVSPIFMGTSGTNVSSNDQLKTNGSQSIAEVSFNVETKQAEIVYNLDYDSNVEIEIYDMNGALVQTIEDGNALEGQEYKRQIETDKFTTGSYVVHVVTNSERLSDKLLVVQ